VLLCGFPSPREKTSSKYPDRQRENNTKEERQTARQADRRSRSGCLSLASVSRVLLGESVPYARCASSVEVCTAMRPEMETDGHPTEPLPAISKTKNCIQSPLSLSSRHSSPSAAPFETWLHFDLCGGMPSMMLLDRDVTAADLERVEGGKV